VAGDPEAYFVGCAVSPFKQTEGETYAQYAKMCKKVGAGARFLITQLGYDARKFEELLRVQKRYHITCPTLASLYVLSPGAARMMHQGRVPGAVVTSRLLGEVAAEWEDRTAGRRAAVERAARLGAVLKGMGYRGIHIGGIHRRFDTVAEILDRMAAIESRWQEFLPQFDYPIQKGFYVFTRPEAGMSSVAKPLGQNSRLPASDKALFHCLSGLHSFPFNFDTPLAGLFRAVCRQLDRRRIGRLLMHLTEDPVKKVFLDCQRCGDCGIQHVAFLCPESQCPKHIRNGACGGSRNGMCEVRPERQCVWFRAFNRWASVGQAHRMASECVPPRMWELNHTSAWLNFYLGRDHQSASFEISDFCSAVTCRLPSDDRGAA
jgi:methylenetetrahydrofolate reductase (NADPH)